MLVMQESSRWLGRALAEASSDRRSPSSRTAVELDLGGPLAAAPHLALWKGGTGDPHAARADPGLLAISTDDVLQALASLPARHRISP
jgi:hypothetical protein